MQDPQGDYNFYHSKAFNSRYKTEPDTEPDFESYAMENQQSNPTHYQFEEQKGHRNIDSRGTRMTTDQDASGQSRLQDVPTDSELGEIYDKYNEFYLGNLLFLVLLFGIVMQVIPYVTLFACFWLFELRAIREKINNLWKPPKGRKINRKDNFLALGELVFAMLFKVTLSKSFSSPYAITNIRCMRSLRLKAAWSSRFYQLLVFAGYMHWSIALLKENIQLIQVL